MYFSGHAGLVFGHWNFSIRRFQYVLDKYPESKYCAAALYNIARTYENEGKTANAMGTYKLLVDQYPDSAESNLAEKRFQMLKPPDQ
jgi:TolA-binding protein